MQYIKSYAFIKRTCLLLSPLFLVTLASKELAFYSPAATLSPIFGGFSDDINSIRKLEAELGLNEPLDGIESYGDLMIQKTGYSGEVWIEQQNPLAGLRYGHEFKYEKLEDGVSKLKITQKSENKYQIDKNSFDASELKDKGALSLLTVFDLTLNHSDSPIPITHVAPLSDLISVNEKDYSIVKVEDKDVWWSDNREEEYRITLRKNNAENSFSIELSRTPVILPSNSSLNGTFSRLTIKSFYILYNDDPPLDPQRFFSSEDSEAGVISDTSSNPRARKVFLNRWKKKDSSKSDEQGPTYQFNIDNNFWKSVCTDPYNVAGFIDKSLKGEPKVEAQKELKKEGDSSAREVLKRQKKSYVNFREGIFHKESHKNQYYWKDFTQEGKWVPSDNNGSEWKHPCGESEIDKETEEKFKAYLSSNKSFYREPIDNTEIKKSIIPSALRKKLQIENEKEESKKHYQRIVQASFRAWGNTYNTKEISGPNIKEKGIYNSAFERAAKTEHSFEITIEEKIWKEQLINNEKLKNNKEKQDISSLIEVNYPIAFEFYDPIANYLRKHKLLLKTELNLRNLYLQSHFSKEVYRLDIGRENRVIGRDYLGFDPTKNPKKSKEYGLDGTLALIAGLELDLKKNLKITLTAQTNGFVNTKNPSCDLRHRLYKIDVNYQRNQSLDAEWRCSEEVGWKYRDYIHIPSFLVVSLTGEPEVSSFYIDNNSGKVSKVPKSETEAEEEKIKINNLKQFEDSLNDKKIIKVVERNEANNGEIYFEDIAAYNPRSNKDLGEHLQLKQGWWGTKYQYIYYYTPRSQENTIELTNKDDLKSLKLYLGGSKHSNSDFFHSGHFNTIKTLCINNKYASSSFEKQCADGIGYQTIEKDKSHSDLTKFIGSQIVEVDWEEIKSKSKENPLVINFRTVLNRSKTEKDTNTFDETKTKLEELFNENKQQPDSDKAPSFSLLAVWYTVELWLSENTLHYVTKIRPISLVSEVISNSSADKTSGASGSAGFQINKLEFIYSKETT